MKEKIKSERVVIAILVVILIAVALIIGIEKSGELKKVFQTSKMEVLDSSFSWVLYDNSGSELKTLIEVKEPDGIDTVTYTQKEGKDPITVNANGKQSLYIDYVVNDKLSNEFTITTKTGTTKTEKVEIEEEKLVADAIKLNVEDVDLTNKKLSVDFANYSPTMKKYYKLGVNGNWQEYTDVVNVTGNEVSSSIDRDGYVTLYAKTDDGVGNVVENKTTTKIARLTSTGELDIIGTSLMDVVKEYDLADGIYNITVTGDRADGTASSYTYRTEWCNYYDAETVYDGTTVVGNTTADQTMLILKYHGNLTVNSGAVLTPEARKKGMLVYSEGKVTNNGEISMTARGAIAQGQDVYMVKNTDNTYEYIPATGAVANGAVSVATSGTCKNGNSGNQGIARATGSGGSGSAYNQSSGQSYTAVSGQGGNGSSYSGGPGRWRKF